MLTTCNHKDRRLMMILLSCILLKRLKLKHDLLLLFFPVCVEIDCPISPRADIICKSDAQCSAPSFVLQVINSWDSSLQAKKRNHWKDDRNLEEGVNSIKKSSHWDKQFAKSLSPGQLAIQISCRTKDDMVLLLPLGSESASKALLCQIGPFSALRSHKYTSC